jgi:hypothetical protein
MAGKIKHIIDAIIQQRAKGNPAIVSTTRIKLIMKGINPDKFDQSSADDPAVIAKLQQLAQELELKI